MKDLVPEEVVKLTDDQVELLLELGDLAKREWELTNKIDEIRKQAEKVGWDEGKSQTKAIHEDTEFDELLSLRFIKEKEIIRGKIAALMKTIIDSGLGDLGLIVRQARNYGIDI